jgi:hypothetical protein
MAATDLDLLAPETGPTTTALTHGRAFLLDPD